jgi:hypothetical protein
MAESSPRGAARDTVRPIARPRHKWLPPQPGQYTFTALAKHLRCSHATLRRHCAALGIDVHPGRRNDRYPSGRLQRKRYKRHLRFLTQSEATRLMLRHYELKGQRVQKAAETAKEP